MINVYQEVDTLVEEGRYKDAAEVARKLGDHARAADLFERIWDFVEMEPPVDAGRSFSVMSN